MYIDKIPLLHLELILISIKVHCLDNTGLTFVNSTTHAKFVIISCGLDFGPNTDS